MGCRLTYKEFYLFLEQVCELLDFALYVDRMPKSYEKASPRRGMFEGLYTINGIPQGGAIWIQRGMKIKEQCHCLCHEICHGLDHLRCKSYDYESSEIKAEFFSIVLIENTMSKQPKKTKYLGYRDLVLNPFFEIIRDRIAKKQYKCSETANFWRELGVDV